MHYQYLINPLGGLWHPRQQQATGAGLGHHDVEINERWNTGDSGAWLIRAIAVTAEEVTPLETKVAAALDYMCEGSWWCWPGHGVLFGAALSQRLWWDYRISFLFGMRSAASRYLKMLEAGEVKKKNTECCQTLHEGMKDVGGVG